MKHFTSEAGPRALPRQDSVEAMVRALDETAIVCHQCGSTALA